VTIYFAGTDAVEFMPQGGGEYLQHIKNEAANANYCDPLYSDFQLNMDASGYMTIEHYLNSLQTGTAWLQARFYADTYDAIASAGVMELLAAGGSVVQLTSTKVRVWDAGAWVELGDSNLGDYDDIQMVLTMEVVLHATAGEVRVYKDGTQLCEFTGVDTMGDNGGSGVDTIRLYKPDNASGSNVYWTEILCGDEDLRDMRVFQKQINANGANTDWTGDYTDIDKLGSVDDLSFIESASAGDVETAGFPNLPSGASGGEVVAVQVSGRARKGASGPSQLQAAVRTGGANYFSASMALDTVFNAFTPVIWPTNPDTASHWTPSEIDALEVGVKSIA